MRRSKKPRVLRWTLKDVLADSDHSAPDIKLRVQNLNGVCIDFADVKTDDSVVIVENYGGKLAIHIWERQHDDPTQTVFVTPYKKAEAQA